MLDLVSGEFWVCSAKLNDAWHVRLLVDYLNLESESVNALFMRKGSDEQALQGLQLPPPIDTQYTIPMEYRVRCELFNFLAPRLGSSARAVYRRVSKGT